MFTRVLATSTALVIAMSMSGYADDSKKSKRDGDYAQIKTAEDVANKLNMLNHKEIECGKLGQKKSENAEVKEFARTLESDHKRANEQVKQFAKANNIDLKKPEKAHDDHKGRQGEPGEPGSVGTPGTKGTPGNERDVEDRDAADRNRADVNNTDTADRNRADATSNDAAWDDNEITIQEEKENMQRIEGLSGEEFDREYTTMMAKAHGKAIRQLTNAKEQVEDAEAKELIAAIIPQLQKHKERATALSRQFGGNPDLDNKIGAQSSR